MWWAVLTEQEPGKTRGTESVGLISHCSQVCACTTMAAICEEPTTRSVAWEMPRCWDASVFSIIIIIYSSFSPAIDVRFCHGLRCEFMWNLSSKDWEKVLPQMLQEHGRSLECVLLTWLSCAACEAKAFPQCLHWNSKHTTHLKKKKKIHIKTQVSKHGTV